MTLKNTLTGAIVSLAHSRELDITSQTPQRLSLRDWELQLVNTEFVSSQQLRERVARIEASAIKRHVYRWALLHRQRNRRARYQLVTVPLWEFISLLRDNVVTQATRNLKFEGVIECKECDWRADISESNLSLDALIKRHTCHQLADKHSEEEVK